MSRLPFSLTPGFLESMRQPSSGYAVSSPLVEGNTARASGSRRRRLWELPHKLHCPIVGVCFDCNELRAMMRKVMRFPSATSDFVLHTTAVGACEQRGQLAELLHKALEKRFHANIRAISGVRESGRLKEVWAAARDSGTDVPSTLWVCWTHPALDAELEQEIFGDIHMLQHQLGAGTRAERAAMMALRAKNSSLATQLEAMAAAAEALRAEKSEISRQSLQTIAGLRTQLASESAIAQRLQQENRSMREALPEERKANAALRRLAAVEIQAEGARQRAAVLEKEVLRLRDYARYAEETIEALAGDAAAAETVELPEPDFNGKRVLCVGGRSGSLSSYREVVEQSGGLFLHHDGGLEESLHRIDNVVAAADIVICQAGCISHNAYWRVKEQCKRTGKPCVFVKNAGVASFGRAVDEAGRSEET